MGSERPLGYTGLPSFVVKFHSSGFDGVARFVPATGLSQDCVGHEFGVEIAQDSVTDFQIIAGGAVPEIVYLDKLGSFRVRGAVRGVPRPNGGQTITVAVGEAYFTLTLDDIGQIPANVGDTVMFTVHDLSLWDEVI